MGECAQFFVDQLFGVHGARLLLDLLDQGRLDGVSADVTPHRFVGTHVGVRVVARPGGLVVGVSDENI